jgi:hypothetical protein
MLVHILFAALETLVDVACRTSFEMLILLYCKFENSQDLCEFTMRLFGSAEDYILMLLLVGYRENMNGRG